MTDTQIHQARHAVRTSAYQIGRADYLNGVRRTACPFDRHEHATAHQAWCAGWDDARDDDALNSETGL